ncbi:MAG: hypothetical protein R2877_05150 [Bdellovibrionota bacterium]
MKSTKIPSSKELQDQVTNHAKSNWMQYLAIAFVAGIVVATLSQKGRADSTPTTEILD